MIYPFHCQVCDLRFELDRSMNDAPDCIQECPDCKGESHRVWVSFRLSTVGCSGPTDPDYIPPEHRVVSDPAYGDSARSADKIERAYAEDIERKGSLASSDNKMKASVPAHLYHGKIRQTGDKHYWKDPKNLARHKRCHIKGQK